MPDNPKGPTSAPTGSPTTTGPVSKPGEPAKTSNDQTNAEAVAKQGVAATPQDLTLATAEKNTGPQRREAPSTPSQSPFVVKARQLERELRSTEGRRSGFAEKQAMLDDLKQMEARREAGADSRLPMTEILRAPIMNAAEHNPDLVYRWIDESRAGRVDIVKAKGYRKIGDAEGGGKVGTLALYGVPRERYGELEAAKRSQTASRLQSFKSDVRSEAERALEDINERSGNKFKTKDVLIDEE